CAADRLCRARRAASRGQAAGTVRARPPSQHRRRTGAARARAVVARASPGASDARSARLLARQLCRSESGDEGPLPAPSLARRSAVGSAHSPRQAALALAKGELSLAKTPFIPAQAGIQGRRLRLWVPTCARTD